MKVLIDECAPRALKIFLAKYGHECLTVQEAGWSSKQNGELLNLAETNYDELVTLDTNLRYQQNLAGRKIAIVVMGAPTNRLADLLRFFPACAQAVEESRPGQLTFVGESA